MAVAVIDIGKTNAKLALVELEALREIAVLKAPNVVVSTGPYPHADVAALWEFVLDSLAALRRDHRIEAISVTTHGATAALLDAEGELALPILDYEFAGVESSAADYAAIRDDFAETGSPRLTVGLNLGAQLFWQQQNFPEAFGRVAIIVAYPQYWGYRLTGVAANEVTSLGCHTDLWSPHRRGFSPMVDRLGWRTLFPPVRSARDRLGTLLPEVAHRTGLPLSTPVLTGIHDSNASLLPHLLRRQTPFAVVSTGTWVVSLAVGARPMALDPERDTLINVNALGDPVPSSRFMGGRENELIGKDLPEASDADIAWVLDNGLFYLPSWQTGSGPFPKRLGGWSVQGSPGQKRAALSFYLALMTATCLELIGAAGPIVVEGPFNSNGLFGQMLRAATGRDVIIAATGTGTSAGAAMLAMPSPAAPELPDRPVAIPPAAWAEYAADWRAAVAAP
ncbi:MAG: FGGY-family carbohydrate kinase [Devosia sp.]